MDGAKMGAELVEIVRSFVSRSIAPLKDRITALEEGSGGGDRAAVDAHALAKQAEPVASLERRASRQADHLSRLEDRVKALEQRGQMMITARQLAELMEATPADEPLFDSLDAMCTAFGFDDATKEQIRHGVDATARAGRYPAMICRAVGNPFPAIAHRSLARRAAARPDCSEACNRYCLKAHPRMPKKRLTYELRSL